MSYQSLSNIAVTLQASVGRIRQAAERASVKPKLVLDGIPYFREADAERIARALRRCQGGKDVH